MLSKPALSSEAYVHLAQIKDLLCTKAMDFMYSNKIDTKFYEYYILAGLMVVILFIYLFMPTWHKLKTPRKRES